MIFWFTYDESEVGLFYIMVMNKSLKFPEGNVILGYKYQSTGFLIEPMHYSRSVFTLLTVKIFYLCYKLVDECSKSSSVTRGWMCIDSCIFADDDKIIIFENYFERAEIGRKCRGDRTYVHLNSVSFSEIIFGI